MAARDKVLYLTYHGIMCRVFDSQVLAYIKELRADFDIRLLAMDSYWNARGEAYQKQRERVRGVLGENCVFGTHIPFAGPLSLRWDARQVYRVAREMLADGGRLVIHGRGQVCGYLGVLAKRAMPPVRTITDVRGATVEETAYAAQSVPAKLALPIRIAHLRSVERVSVSEADAVFAVSTPLMEYLARKYQMPGVRKIIPTCVNTSAFTPDPNLRQAAREKLGIGDRFAVMYSGSMAYWHLPDGIVRTFARIKQLVPDSYLVLLTKDRGLAEQSVRRASLSEGDYTIQTAQHMEVPRYLAAGDLAILVRDSSVVNAVACPTKFAEYLSCGLPVAVSPGVGDTETVVRKYGVGIVLPEGLNRESLHALRADASMRERAIQAAREMFDLRLGSRNIAEAYNTLLSGETNVVERTALA